MNKNTLGFVRMRVVVSLLLFLISACSAQAYIGPGLGAGAVASVLSIFAGIGLLIVGAAYYPLKKLFNALKGLRKSKVATLPPPDQK
jgi:hypothetical protein